MNLQLCTADRLFDGTGAAALSHPVLHIGGDRVEAIGTRAFPPPAPAPSRVTSPAARFCLA